MGIILALIAILCSVLLTYLGIWGIIAGIGALLAALGLKRD